MLFLFGKLQDQETSLKWKVRMKYLIHWKSFFGITLTRYTKLWTTQINKCLLQEASLNNIAHESLYKNVLGGLNTRF